MTWLKKHIFGLTRLLSTWWDLLHLYCDSLHLTWFAPFTPLDMIRSIYIVIHTTLHDSLHLEFPSHFLKIIRFWWNFLELCILTLSEKKVIAFEARRHSFWVIQVQKSNFHQKFLLGDMWMSYSEWVLWGCLERKVAQCFAHIWDILCLLRSKAVVHQCA